MATDTYDLAVIGSGPAGQKASIAAAKHRKKVVVVDQLRTLGGACLHTGTIPSKTMREAVLYLTGFRQRTFYGQSYTLKKDIRVEDLMVRVTAVVNGQLDVIQDQLRRNHVDTLDGHARFVDPHTLEVDAPHESRLLRAETIVIACGTRPARPADIPFGEKILDADQVVQAVAGELPRSATVVGAGVIGLEYASVLSALDIRVTVVEGREEMLTFVDRDMVENLSFHLRRRNVTFRLGEKVAKISREEAQVVAHLESGKLVRSDVLLYAVGRQPNSDGLNLEAVGIDTDERGRIPVNEHFQTEVPHVYAVGDVIGFPALASTSMEQGRVAAHHAMGAPLEHIPELLPYGIYTIPEVAMVGRTEQELTAAKIPYEVGIARFEELAKAAMLGDDVGLLKILFDPDSHKLFGVHLIGVTAAELLHIGQAVLAMGGTLDFLANNVFNYPTLAEAYKVAALNGLNKL
jgi:NAD(P) transhydrogenase